MIAESAVIARILNWTKAANHARSDVMLLGHRFGLTAGGVFVAVSLDDFCTKEPFDQGGEGSCEGHGHAQGIWATFNAAGAPLSWVPSPNGLYVGGRIMDRKLAGLPNTATLQDIGTVSTSVCQWMNLYGIEPMRCASVRDPEDAAPRFSDCSAATVNKEPDFVELETESQNIFVGQYSCEGVDDASRLAAVNLSLSLRIPPAIGGFVDTNYMRWEPSDGVYQRANRNDPKGGGHCQLITGVRMNAKGLFEYRIRNSWGPWCDGGFIWVSQQFILDADELTAMAVRRAPKMQIGRAA
jgi:hypothetical protein